MTPRPGNPDSAAGQRHRVLLQLWRLLELTRDIERSDEDARFAQGGGRIDYVFDENVFEMFVDPHRQARFVRLFHADALELPIPKSFRDSITAQSALVTAEHLFNGHLPGQHADRPIYLTEWHFAELTSRFFDIAQDVRKRIRGAAPPAAPPGDLGSVAAADELTLADLDAFTTSVAERTHDLRVNSHQFIAARTAARLMIDDEMQVLLQLRRLGSKDLIRRIAPLTEPVEFRPSRDEAQRIRNDAIVWKRRLEDEQKIQRGVRFSARSSGAIDNDAFSIAQLVWISNGRPQPSRRCVLVTGDRLLFDAYRRWHSSQPPATPFLLRRVVQFAPLIYSNDDPGDTAAPDLDLFGQTRKAIQAAILPFGLSPRRRQKEGAQDDPDPNRPDFDDGLVATGLEFLALKLSERANDAGDVLGMEEVLFFFAPLLTKDWLDARQVEFDRLNERWASMERFSIGLRYDLIMHRYRETQGTAGEFHQTTPGTQEAYALYLESVFQELTADAIKLFFPTAVLFIRNVAGSEYSQPGYSRAPATVRLHVPGTPDDSSEVADLADLIQRWVQGEVGALRLLDPSNNTALADNPPFVFAVAATLALRLSNWNEAERFSYLALTGSESAVLSAARRCDSASGRQPEPRPGDVVSSQYYPAAFPGQLSIGSTERSVELYDAAVADYFELLYLHAVSRRFRIGSISPRWSGASTNIWAELRGSAVSQLTMCLERHRSKGELLHHLRAVSERAAVRLFYVTWVLLMPPEVLEQRQMLHADAEAEMFLAVKDLHDCLCRLERPARERASRLPQNWQESAHRVERQYVTNAAAAAVLAFIERPRWLDDAPAFWFELVAEISRRIASIESEAAQPHPIIAADFLAFRILYLRDESAQGKLRQLVRSRPALRLAIDQEVLAFYARNILEQGR